MGYIVVALPLLLNWSQALESNYVTTGTGYYFAASSVDAVVYSFALQDYTILECWRGASRN
jgi:hypothetical protein